MASPSGASSGSSLIQINSGSEEDLQQVMDQRKRKRMLSNRESARRSRMKKQKHLDDLMAQLSQLRKENNHILTSINISTQQYLKFESENSILRAQMSELSQRLQALNEIINYVDSSNIGGFETEDLININNTQMINDDNFINPWNSPYLNQPIMMASADLFMY